MVHKSCQGLVPLKSCSWGKQRNTTKLGEPVSLIVADAWLFCVRRCCDIKMMPAEDKEAVEELMGW